MSAEPTSSSTARVPWALLLSLAIVAGFEVWIRTWPATTRIAYVDDEDQAVAVRNQINEGPTPAVAFVGSSMMYQGVSVPAVEKRLAQALGRPIRVGNFAIRGGRIDLTEATVRTLLRQREKPALIVVGIALRDLREHGLELDRLSQLWTLADWRREAHGDSWHTSELPQVIRNEIGRAWRTLRYRRAIALAAERPFVDITPEPMPARGQSPSQHESSRRDQSLADDPSAFKNRNNKRRMMQAYRPELPATPPTMLSDRVHGIIEACARANVRVIFVDMPISRPLRDLINTAQDKSVRRDASKEFEPAYRKVVGHWTDKGGVPFIASESVGTWTDADFFDGQHLNYSGALKLSDALVPLIERELGGRQSSAASTGPSAPH